MKRDRQIPVLVIVIISAALLAAGAGPQPSDALLPRSRPSIVPVHQLHPRGDPPCRFCHRRATSSGWASDRLIPRMSSCAPCHPEVEGTTALSAVTSICGKCHLKAEQPGAPLRGNYPRPNIRFSHRAHGKVVSCASCHRDAAAGKKVVAVQSTVSMQRCYNCHNRKGASRACRTCHLVRANGKMITGLGGRRLTPPAWLVGPNHGVEWVSGHASRAGANTELCNSCHEEQFCQGCHSGRLRPRNLHPGDWISSHGVTTRLGNPHCRGCHRKQSFCLTCHRRAGVAPDSPEATLPAAGPGRYHGNTSVEQLCRRARYEITACVSCHTESSCITCHAVKNPHPPAWRRKCKPLARRNRRACVKCHLDEAWKRCR